MEVEALLLVEVLLQTSMMVAMELRQDCRIDSALGRGRVFAVTVPVASLLSICGWAEVQLDCCSTVDGFSICCRGKLESRQ